VQPSSAIREAMLEFYARRSAADVAAFDDLISSEHVVFLGTEGAEWFEDRERMRKAFGFEGVRFEPGLAGQAWEEGTIGWWVDTPLMTLAELGSVRTRATFVLRREDGRWKVVHAHFSVGIPDERAVALQAELGSG